MSVSSSLYLSWMGATHLLDCIRIIAWREVRALDSKLSCVFAVALGREERKHVMYMVSVDMYMYMYMYGCVYN